MKRTLVTVLMLMILFSASGCTGRDIAGGGQITVIATGDHFAQPVWSPNGEQIVVVKDNREGITLEVLDPEKKERRTLAQVGNAPKSPGWAGQDVLFLNGFLENVTLQRLKGKNVDMLRDVSGTIDASWSRDGHYVVLKRLQERNANDIRLWLLDLETMEEREILIGVVPYHFRLSPSGRYLAVTTNDQSGGTLLVEDLQTGTVVTRWHIARSEGALSDIAWGPDEKVLGVWRLAGERERGFYVLLREGSGTPFRLTPVEMAYPDWSPDGNRIVYATAGVPGKNDLRILTLPDGWRNALESPDTNPRP